MNANKPESVPAHRAGHARRDICTNTLGAHGAPYNERVLAALNVTCNYQIFHPDHAPTHQY
jgi:hypothetical protein